MSGSPSHAVTRRAFVAGTAAVAGSAALAGPLAGAAVAAGFGWRDDGTNYVADTGAALVFKVSKSTGDLTSLVYKGTEYQGYGGKNSHIESGLGSSTVTLAQSGSTILISVTHGTLRHYYAARAGENHIYLWTNKADSSVSATRFILRVRAGLFLNDEPDSYTYTTSTIEASDVFAKPDGQTRSKHYSKVRVIDYDYTGWSAGGVGLWIVRSNHEKASGGPFYRSLLRHQSADGGGLYEILYYGENQTEAERYGLQGPYVIAFTDGGAPPPRCSRARSPRLGRTRSASPGTCRRAVAGRSRGSASRGATPRTRTPSGSPTPRRSTGVRRARRTVTSRSGACCRARTR